MKGIPLPFSLTALFAGISLISSLFFVQGCNSNGSTPRYPTAAAGIAHTLDMGTVVNSRRIVIDGQSTNMGVYAGVAGGGAVGSAVGAEVGGTSLSTAVGGAGGMIAGAVLGPKLEKKLNSKPGDELTIEMDNGRMIVVIQEIREPAFYPGERVRVHADYYGNSRVFHMDEDPYVDPDTAAYLPPEFDHGLIEENTKKPDSKSIDRPKL